MFSSCRSPAFVARWCVRQFNPDSATRRAEKKRWWKQVPPPQQVSFPPRKRSELEPSGQLDNPRVTAEDAIRFQEVICGGVDLVKLRDSRAGGSDWINCVHRTRNILRVVERVEEVSTELDVLRFPEFKILEYRDIEVGDVRRPEGIASEIGDGAVTGLNVSGIRIIGQVSHYGSRSGEGIAIILKASPGYLT